MFRWNGLFDMADRRSRQAVFGLFIIHSPSFGDFENIGINPLQSKRKGGEKSFCVQVLRWNRAVSSPVD
jgi:hypothetical protein